jgi:O-succinylbenzoic acid--CoA ligase
MTYGMTEMASQVATQEAVDARVDSPRLDCGRPLPGVEVRLADDGRIEVRGPQLAPRYFGSPEPLAGPDGYFTTSDCGKMVDGRLVVLGRMDEAIISGGENVVPEQVEAHLEEQDSIESACVVGLPDPKWGQRLCAVVSVRGEPEPEIWAIRLREVLPSFAIPKEFFVVPTLRRLPSLKCDRVWAAQTAASMQARGAGIDPSS